MTPLLSTAVPTVSHRPLRAALRNPTLPFYRHVIEDFAAARADTPIENQRRSMQVTPGPSMTHRLPAQDERLGMAWWNAMNKAERIRAMVAAEARLFRDTSIAEAWIVWKTAAIPVAQEPGSRSATHRRHLGTVPTS